MHDLYPSIVEINDISGHCPI